MEGISELGVITGTLRTPGLRPVDPWGLVVHTTGSGIVDQAHVQKKDPLLHADAYYAKADYYPHYVCGWDGRLFQIANERQKAPHVGFAERTIYLEPDWETKVSETTARMWRKAWPSYPSPAYLFPGTSVNAYFVGVELLPLVMTADGEPAYPGCSFTEAQHQMVVLLARDLAERWKWPAGWQNSPRLLGHEDCNPITRSDKNGGWDPGAMRVLPRFSWRWVRAICAGEDPGPISP